MVDICFCASTAGSLYYAKKLAYGASAKGEDVIFFSWMMDIGYLKEGIESPYRSELPGKLLMQSYYGWGNKEGIPGIGERCLKTWKTLITRLENGESARVWYGDAPDDLCGLFHLCTLLQNYKNDIFNMPTPRFAQDGKRRYFANSWAAIEPVSISKFVDTMTLMDKNEIKLYAEHWQKLTDENAPLRAVISGVPTSVDEDFYDRFLEHNLPKEPLKESELIGNTLGAYNLGISCCWLEHRVQSMIDEGKIRVVKDSDVEAIKRIIQRC